MNPAASKAVIVIPTLKRPEFLALCLERLSQTPEADLLDIRIFLDTCTDERMEDVTYCRNTYFPSAEIYRAKEHIQVLSGCWNILNALRQGYESEAEFVFLVEEDVMVRPSFIQWHLTQHESANYFVTCGRRHGMMPLDFYTNPGTCYRRESLALVMPHINDEYFDDPRTYLDKTFPMMKGMDGPLDDGLIRKVQRSVNGLVTSAVPGVCVHQGFHYYNNIGEYTNRAVTIQERISEARRILALVDPNGRYTKDFEAF